jgi:hypothetical protein
MSIDVNEVNAVKADGGLVRFEPPDLIIAVGPTRESSLRVQGLGRSNWVELWCGQDWCCLIGLKDNTVIVARPAEGRVEAVGELDRLDLTGGYDPGGLERVDFDELPDGDLLLIHELGLARISPSVGLVWQATHDQLGVMFEGIEHEVAWFAGEDERYGFRVKDGRAEVK